MPEGISPAVAVLIAWAAVSLGFVAGAWWQSINSSADRCDDCQHHDWLGSSDD